MIERPFCFRNRGRVVTTDRATDGVAIANEPVRITCGTPNGEHVRVAQESGRKRIVAESAASSDLDPLGIGGYVDDRAFFHRFVNAVVVRIRRRTA